MTTFGSLLTRIMYTLGDPTEAVWSRTDQVWYWLIEAIREFPILRPNLVDLSFATDVHSDALPADFVSVVWVEYPIGEDPIRFNLRRSHEDPEFNNGYYYDIGHNFADGSGWKLWMGQAVASDVRVRYLALHDTDAAEAMLLTIPDQYLNILSEYCLLRAWTERLSTEIGSPTAHTSTIQQINDAIAYHRKTYNTLVETAIREMSTSLIIPSRRSDEHDRIY